MIKQRVQMDIEFNLERWDKVKQDTARWWKGELNRPLIQLYLRGREPQRQKSELPFYEFTSFYDLSIPAEKIIDAWDYELSKIRYLGDAYPNITPNFGPGVVAAYMGAALKNGDNTVWFHPEKDMDIKDIDFDYLSENKWLKRTCEIIEQAHKRWQGLVQIGMVDLGGNMDILQTFRQSENLLYDLYDNPADVKRLTWKANDLWWQYYKQLNSLSDNKNPGYSNWARIFSDKPSYILQCDFCHMIGPDQFDEFVKPELERTSSRLRNVFYHLDGPGQLAHLDSILEIDSIEGIQWIPGAGQPDITKWPDVYKKIANTGKKIQLFSSLAVNPVSALDIISDQIGRLDNVLYVIDADLFQAKEYENIIFKYQT